MTQSFAIPYIGYSDGIARARSIVVWLIFATSFVVSFEPAPCDVMAILSILFFILPGVNILPAITPLLLLYVLFLLGYLTSYFVNGADDQGAFFLASSSYALLSSLFLACFISQDTEKRFDLIKSGFYVGGVIAAAIAMAAYVYPKSIGEALIKIGASDFIHVGRASGAFKDPNVFSTYLVFPAVMMFQKILLGQSKRLWITLLWLGLVFLALFLAFSRGAWINLTMAIVLLILLTIMTTPSKSTRTRIFFYSFVAIVFFAIILTVLLSIPEIQAIFNDRFSLTKKYDVGERGRFGNQLNAIPLLLAKPFGLGPYRFDKYFSEAPHNAFLNAFSAGGWVGGITYFTLVFLNIFIGIRTVFKPSPYQSQAILVFACLVAVTFQGIQIDTEHWRHYYWMIGMMWGLFAASIGPKQLSLFRNRPR